MFLQFPKAEVDLEEEEAVLLLLEVAALLLEVVLLPRCGRASCTSRVSTPGSRSDCR